MSRKVGAGAVVVAVLALSGCFHAIVDTGRQPSGTVVQNQWAHSFLYGLVPPSPVDVAQQCPGGIAKVETQHSFLNGLAAALTFSLYTPMTITVHCAAAGGEDVPSPSGTVRVPAGASDAEVMAAIERAAAMTSTFGIPAYLVMSEQ